jgi:hypothetical protein
LKFHDGGWITLTMTASLAVVATLIKRHYKDTLKLLRRLNSLVDATGIKPEGISAVIKYDPQAKTAGILVNGFNGLGLHTLLGVIKNFGKDFHNFVFIQVGVIDAGNFKGKQEMDRLKESVDKDLKRYVEFMNNHGYYAETFSSIGTEVVEESENLVDAVIKRYPDIVFFGGQLVFPQDTFMTRLLHNYTVFSIQRRFYQKGIPFMVLPIRV